MSEHENPPQELIQIDLSPPNSDSMKPIVDYEARRGTCTYPREAKKHVYKRYPKPRDRSTTDKD